MENLNVDNTVNIQQACLTRWFVRFNLHWGAHEMLIGCCILLFLKHFIPSFENTFSLTTFLDLSLIIYIWCFRIVLQMCCREEPHLYRGHFNGTPYPMIVLYVHDTQFQQNHQGISPTDFSVLGLSLQGVTLPFIRNKYPSFRNPPQRLLHPSYYFTGNLSTKTSPPCTRSYVFAQVLNSSGNKASTIGPVVIRKYMRFKILL